MSNRQRQPENPGNETVYKPGLVFSLPRFGFYHADAARCLSVTNGRIRIEDGRGFLKRAGKKFDVIVVDPPPVVAAAGS